MKTLQELLALASTNEGKEEICIMVAEAVGFIFNGPTRSVHCPFWGQPIPPYHTSLDAIMPEARKRFFKRQTYLDCLNEVMAAPIKRCIRIADRDMVFAEAIHHCIALLLISQQS